MTLAAETFAADREYRGGNWWAVVTRTRGGITTEYWHSPRLTGSGAAFAARRRARKLTRLQRRGIRLRP